MTPPPLRIVFFGTPAFAAPTLEALFGSRHPVVGVVTQPDRPQGRGRRVTFSPVKARALEAGVPVLQPERLKDPAFLAALAAWQPDLGVVAAYGRILPQAVIDTPRLGLINVHASLLPRYRGAAPIQRAVMAGESETGISIMRIVPALDAGGVFATVGIPIAPDATSADVERELAVAGAELLVQVVEDLARGTASETPQDDSQATFAQKVTRDDSPIDWSLSAADIHNRVRGLAPWPHASTTVGGARLILTRSAVEPEAAAPAAPGTVIEAAGDRLRVATGSGVLRVLELQPEGRRAMSAREYLAGHALPAGIRLG